MSKPNGAVIYRGPSMLDGSPIVVIATGLNAASLNTKTGDIVQTWILREDVSPTEAVKTGEDAAICGACPHRGTIEDGKNVGRTCYVTVFQAPLNVFKSFHRGIYPTLSREEAAAALTGRKVRLGSYGDPAAAPLDMWEAVLVGTVGRTGYTHQWRTAPQGFARLVMASSDSPQDAIEAQAQGYRTFRVTALAAPQDKRTGEVVCPASKEAGTKTNCAACLACGGTSAKARANIVITVHGAAGKVNAFARAAA